jgi:septin family protein
MSRMIDRLIGEIIADDMVQVKKMKKAELLDLAKMLMQDNLRELTDDTIVKMYEQQFSTNLSGV